MGILYSVEIFYAKQNGTYIQDSYFFCSFSQNEHILFVFDVLQIKKTKKCTKDYVEIIDSSFGRTIGRFCRLRQIHGNLVTFGNKAIVRFYTNSQKVRSGFSLRYQAGIQRT